MCLSVSVRLDWMLFCVTFLLSFKSASPSGLKFPFWCFVFPCSHTCSNCLLSHLLLLIGCYTFHPVFARLCFTVTSLPLPDLFSFAAPTSTFPFSPHSPSGPVEPVCPTTHFNKADMHQPHKTVPFVTCRADLL